MGYAETIAAADQTERVAAQRALANLPVRELVDNPVVPYEADEVTRLIVDSHDCAAFAPIAAMSVGELRDWLLSESAPGTLDAARNCISNIRPLGLPIEEAAERLVALITAARRHRMTGVALGKRLATQPSRLIPERD